MPKYILVKCRTTRVLDIEITDGILQTSSHSSVSDALEELIYDPDYDWVIIEANRSSGGGYGANVKIVRRREASKVKKYG